MSDILTISSSASSLSAPTRGQAEGSPALDPSDGVSGMSTVSLESRGDSITRGMKVALVKMMFRSDQAKEVIAQLERFGKAECSPSDYYALARLNLAEQRKGSYHVLTLKGRHVARDAMIELARADGIHALQYEYEPSGGAAGFVACTCGFRAHKSRYYASYRSILYRFGDHHLRHVGAK